MMTIEANRIEQLHEQCVRSLHPVCEFEKRELHELQAHREKRNQIEQLLLQILQRTASIQKD